MAPALLLIALLSAAPAPASSNPYLTSAVRLYYSLQFDAALEQLAKAAKRSTGPSDDVLIHTYRGLIELEKNRPDRAESEFRIALSLDLEAKPPADVSPKVTAMWERIRGQLAKEHLALQTEPPPKPAPPVESKPEPKPEPKPDVKLEPRPEPKLQPTEVAPEPAGGVATRAPAPSSTAAWAWTGVAGTGLVTGGVLAVLARSSNASAASEHYGLDSYNAHQVSRGEAAAAYSALGVGVVAGAVATYLWATR